MPYLNRNNNMNMNNYYWNSQMNNAIKKMKEKINNKETLINKNNQKINGMKQKIKKIEEESKQYEKWIEKEDEENKKLRFLLNYLTDNKF